MTQPAGPPPYDAIYSQGVKTDPVESQPQPQALYVITSRMHLVDNDELTFTEKPAIVVCPTCKKMVKTRHVVKPALRTHMCALILCCCGLWPCFAIPYCMSSCNNVEHYCPTCEVHLGSYNG